MQPYFLPYLGYFALMKHTDYWIVFDTPQFIRHSWIERNRILKPLEGWQYIKIPLKKHSRDTSIQEIRIKNSEEWGEKILAQLTHYKKAPHYDTVTKLVYNIVFYDTDSIVNMDVNALSLISNYLGIDFKYNIYSESDFRIEDVNTPDEWALEISKILKADIYINLPGGMDFFNKNKFKRDGIDLKFIKIKLTEYNQERIKFEPGLSIIDVMMFNTPEEIFDMLNIYELI